MQTATVHVQILDQEIGYNTESGGPNLLKSTMWFDIEFQDQRYEGARLHINQTFGEDYLTAPVEIVGPIGYEGPLDREQFRVSVANVYRRVMQGQCVLALNKSQTLRATELPRTFGRIPEIFSFKVTGDFKAQVPNQAGYPVTGAGNLEVELRAGH